MQRLMIVELIDGTIYNNIYETQFTNSSVYLLYLNNEGNTRAIEIKLKAIIKIRLQD